MRLVSYVDGERAGWGIVEGDEVVDLSGRWPSLRSAIAEAELEELAAVGAAPRIKLASLRFAPVIPDAGKILCVGHNYESHRVETGREATGHPSIFIRFADSQVGHKQAIVRPSVSSMLDFEGELAVVIGRGGRVITKAQALDHVLGYTCFNDASVRDWQWHTKQFAPGKNFPSTGASGPWLVTADEIPNPSMLSVTTRLNGEIMQSQPASEMIFSIPTLIAYISVFTRLAPGDIIVTGTPGGVGAKRQPPVWMKAGDVVEVEIAGVGCLVNEVADEVQLLDRVET